MYLAGGVRIETVAVAAPGVGWTAAPRFVEWLAAALDVPPAWGLAKIAAPKTAATNTATSRPIATVTTVRFPACRMSLRDASAYLTFASFSSKGLSV